MYKIFWLEGLNPSGSIKGGEFVGFSTTSLLHPSSQSVHPVVILMPFSIKYTS
jgi:hypothetical protein